MSKRTVRSILAGTALVMALTMTFPGSTEAAGWSGALRGGDVLELVLHWFSALWNGGHEASPQNRAVLKDQSASPPGPGNGTNGSSAPCGGEQGVCIDPNG